jgi:hypothetical protein
VLVEWAVAFDDWVFATIWPEEHDDVTLERSDEKLWVLEQKCAAIVKKADKDWCFRKMHELVLFVPHIRRSGLGIVSKHIYSGVLNSEFWAFRGDPGGRFSAGLKTWRQGLVVGSL